MAILRLNARGQFILPLLPKLRLEVVVFSSGDRLVRFSVIWLFKLPSLLTKTDNNRYRLSRLVCSAAAIWLKSLSQATKLESRWRRSSPAKLKRKHRD